MPGGGRGPQGRYRAEAAVLHALPHHGTQFVLGDVQPAFMFGRTVGVLGAITIVSLLANANSIAGWLEAAGTIAWASRFRHGDKSNFHTMNLPLLTGIRLWRETVRK